MITNPPHSSRLDPVIEILLIALLAFMPAAFGVVAGWSEWIAFATGSAIALLLAIYIALGTFMESYTVMIVTLPMVTPLILGMGYDIVWWGIIMMMVVEVGMIHPPLGLNVFVLKSITPDIPIWTIYKGVLPFCVADLIKLILMVLIPAITLWLPSTMIH